MKERSEPTIPNRDVVLSYIPLVRMDAGNDAAENIGVCQDSIDIPRCHVVTDIGITDSGFC